MVVAAATGLPAGCGSTATKTVTVRAPATTKRAPATTQSAPAGTTATQTASTPPPPIKTVSLREFRSPTGNLGCEMYAFGGGGARCDIAKRAWKPGRKPASCRLDYGQGLEVNGPGRGRFTCAGDTALNPQATPLPYGEGSTVGHFTCISETNGMTCENDTTKHGFFISVQGYSLF
jgi:hypothetical protein